MLLREQSLCTGWVYINLNGDYVWRNNLKLGTGKYRPLRSVDIESYKKTVLAWDIFFPSGPQRQPKAQTEHGQDQNRSYQ